MKHSTIGNRINQFVENSNERLNLRQYSIDDKSLSKRQGNLVKNQRRSTKMNKLNLTAFTLKDYSTIGTALTVDNSFANDGNHEYELLSKQSQEASD